ncbi:RNA methyltransferase [bacterium]|nr:RNA methyltransferase [bacterium]MCI0604914.1 RNA methyltransferase [bacterium]
MHISKATDAHQVQAFSNISRQWRKQFEAGSFYAEGEQVVSRLLQSELSILTMLITEKHFEQWKPLIQRRQKDETTIWIAEKKWTEENTGQKLNQPCLALAKIPPDASLEHLIRKDSCCLVALDGIDHAVNVGAIVRNCAAFGVIGLLVDETSVHPYSWRAVRTSLGSVFQVPVAASNSLSETLRLLQNQYQITLIAADPEGSVRLSDLDFSKNSCFIFGNEHRGISKKILSLAPVRVAIPLSGKVDSLNVAAASAIFLYAGKRM